MTLSAQAIETRALISRSDMLFIDTRRLRYATGLYHHQDLSPAPVKELMEAGELEFKNLSAHEVAIYTLTTEAFKAAIATRKRNKNTQRLDWLHHVVTSMTSGAPTDSLLVDPLTSHVLLVPFNPGLLNKLLSATSNALDLYKKDLRFTGTTIRFPGYLVPLKVVETLNDSTKLELFPFFENVDLNIMISIQYGTYTFGTYVHGYYTCGPTVPIAHILNESADALGDIVNRATQKLAHKLERDPLIAAPSPPPDADDPLVVDAINSGSNYKPESERQ